jgi:heterodisulfide reductase subunit C
MVVISKLDHGFKDEIATVPGGEQIKRCFSCGTCTAGCPVAEVAERYNPRRIIRMALLGMRHDVLSSDFIWLCSACYTCYERCPQDVRIPDLMTAIKNLAVRQGYTPSTFITQMDLLKVHGRLYEIGAFENQKRRDLGLPVIRGNAQEIQRILCTTGIETLLMLKK